jgi:hypothetical protein
MRVPIDRLDQPGRSSRPKQETPTMPMRSRPARAVAVMLLAIGVTACSKTLDTEGLESQLKSQIEEQTDGSFTSVDCPDDVEAKAGETFDCTAEEEESGATFTIRVTQRDGEGNVDWEVVDASA